MDDDIIITISILTSFGVIALLFIYITCKYKSESSASIRIKELNNSGEFNYQS